MNLLYTVLALVLVGVAILLLESKREIKRFSATDYTIEIDQCKHGKVLILSDLHNKEYGHNNCILVEAIKSEEPDMIWIAGDMVIGKEGKSLEVPLRLMEELVKVAPVYYGNGNHEQRMKEDTIKYGDTYEELKEALQSTGVVLLENETVTAELGGKEIHITGLEIPFEYYDRGLYDTLKVETIEAKIGKKKAGYQVLLAHNPVHAESYEKWGADLVVSGHLHGGIIRLPVWGGVITPQVRLFPKHSGGFYTLGNTRIIVSRGLGEHTVKIRFMNKPELIVLHVKGQE